MSEMFVVIVGGVLFWFLGFAIVWYAATAEGSHLNVLHAIILGNIMLAAWFLFFSVVNVSRTKSR